MDTLPPTAVARNVFAYDPSRDEMVEVVNLSGRDTGAEGTIFISTRMAAHGPRIKWFPLRPERDAPCLVVTLEDPPRAINLGLAQPVARRGEAQALAWASANRVALLDYWENGVSWTRDEVSAFIDGLRKLP